MKKFSVLIGIAITIAGCGENTPVQTVDWYKTHDIERKEMIVKCNANPGELAASPNCINAQEAQNEKELSRRGFLKLPPVGTGEKGK